MTSIPQKNSLSASRRSSLAAARRASLNGNTEAMYADYNAADFFNFDDAQLYDTTYPDPSFGLYQYDIPDANAPIRRASKEMVSQPLVSLPHEGLFQIGMDEPLSNNIHPRLAFDNYSQHDTYLHEYDQPYPAVYGRANPNGYQEDWDPEVLALDDDDLQGSVKVPAAPRSRQNSKETPYNSPEAPNSSRRTSSDTNDGASPSLKKSRRTHAKNIVAQYQAEKPVVVEDKPWIRINASTKGLSTRTGKNNQYNPREFYDFDLPHPLGTWIGPKTKFSYTKDGEFSQKTYTAKELREFIYEYPKDKKGCKLKLWIQRAPTDSSRRYLSSTWAKCRFRDCPIQRAMAGTILHGHYRVAFDENWHKYGGNHDPLLVTGYAHLYCMERFLDFADICKKFAVEVDTRYLVNEPGHKFAATLANSHEGPIAQQFIEACKDKTLHEHHPHYPVHALYRYGDAKPHEHTLCYAMTKKKSESRPPAQQKQFAKRGEKETHICVNLGDLERIAQTNEAEKAIKKAEKLAKKKQKKAATTSSKKRQRKNDDETDSEEDIPAPSSKRVKKTGRARKAKAANDSDSDSDGAFQPLGAPKPTKKTRSSPRKPTKVAYTEPPIDPEEEAARFQKGLRDTIAVYQARARAQAQAQAPMQIPPGHGRFNPALQYQGPFAAPVAPMNHVMSPQIHAPYYQPAPASQGYEAPTTQWTDVDWQAWAESTNNTYAIDGNFDPTADNGWESFINPEDLLQRRQSSLRSSHLSAARNRLAGHARKVITGERRESKTSQVSPTSASSPGSSRRFSARLNSGRLSELGARRDSLGTLFSPGLSL